MKRRRQRTTGLRMAGISTKSRIGAAIVFVIAATVVLIAGVAPTNVYQDVVRLVGRGAEVVMSKQWRLGGLSLYEHKQIQSETLFYNKRKRLDIIAYYTTWMR